MNTAARNLALTIVGLLVTLTSIAVMPPSAHAQSTGNKGVYGASGVQPSTIWIDASAWWTASAYGQDPDICQIINTIITQPSYSSPAVIDARGLYNNSGNGSAALNCTGNPFQNAPANMPATTVLLPSGSIPISTPWVLPNATRIIGEGQNTNLDFEANLPAGQYLIYMGDSSLCPSSGCSSIGVEHLVIDAQKKYTGGGIYNGFSQAGTYVNNVNFNGFVYGTGLYVDVGAANSGPYTNLAYGTASGAAAFQPVCVDIETQTVGIHGITCIGNATTAMQGPPNSNDDEAGIYINASNNSVEDIHIESFWDGIEIGNVSTSTVGNVVVSNVTGTQSGGTSCTNGACVVHNVVHICGSNSNATRGKCSNPGSGNVHDVTLLQIGGEAYSYATGLAAVQDDASGTSIVKCTTSGTACSPPTTALYSLGEGVAGGFSRFASNPSNTSVNYDPSSSFVPTWGVGSNSITSGTSCLTPGATYSNITGTTGSSFYVCTYNGTGFNWKPIA